LREQFLKGFVALGPFPLLGHMGFSQPSS